ncbi:DNA ligase D [Sphingobacterium puteale]|uniref:DNA ligase D n=1 Tax=Sphingobacterium puteale TaxID=2420510 RepID=UPI003D986307
MKKMPAHISPMLCTLVKDPLDSEDYLYEVKWDGYRIVSFVEKGKVHMDSRSGLNYTAKYPPVEKALKSLKHDVIIDGEVVVFNQEEKPDFDALQLYNGHDSPIRYCVFDLLWLDGQDLRGFPLTERKELLKMLVKDNDTFRFSESFDDGPALYQQMLDLNLEGIVAKKRDSQYIEGNRGNDWLKTPTRKRQEFVIGGWAESDKARSFKSLLFGAYENGKFTWIGRSGGGFKDKEMPGILKKLQAIEVDESPFVNKVLDTKGAKMHWVKPQLVANFEFATWTKTGRIRKPATFLGFRLDKKPKQVVREVPKSAAPIEAEVAKEKSASKVRKDSKRESAPKKLLNKDSNWQRVDESFEGSEVTDFPMKNCTIQLHDIGRELWKGVAKGDLILYYNKIASYILTYLKDRPQSLNLKLTAAGGPTTFIKDMENRQPDCAEVFKNQRRVKKVGKRDQIDYLVCNNVETLLTMVNWGCVDINPWASRIQHPEKPDYIWLDLDPTVTKKNEDQGFEQTIQVAIAAKKVFDKYKLKGFVKTSGKTGLHIYIPCSGFTFEQARIIANLLADEIHQLVPAISTRSEAINHRKGKVYIDANQNDYADTLAAPYSVRPYHKPIVSTPLEWKEVKPKLDRYKFTMSQISVRLKQKGDLFSGLHDIKINKSNNLILSLLLNL